MASYGENGSKRSFMGMSADVLSTIDRNRVMLALAPRGPLTRSLLLDIVEGAIKNNLKPIILGTRNEMRWSHGIINEGVGTTLSSIRIDTKYLFCPAANTDVGVSELSIYCGGDFVYDKCPYLKNFDLETFRRIGQDGGNTSREQTDELIEKGMCPSKYLFDSAADADIVISDFGLIFHNGWENSIEILGRRPKDTLLVILDPFSLLEHVWNEYSFNVRREELYTKDWDLPGLDDIYVKALQAVFDSLKIMMNEIDVGKQIEKSQLNVLYREALRELDLDISLADILKGLRNILSGGGVFSTVGSRKKANDLYLFLSLWRSQFSGLARMAAEDEDGFMIRVSLLDPHDVVENVLSHVGPSFFIGDSLYPHNIFAQLLGINMDDVLSRSYIDKEVLGRTHICCFTNMDTSLKNRNDEVYSRIGENLKSVINNTPGRTFVIFPSYEIMGNVLEHMDLYALEKPAVNEVRGSGKDDRLGFIEDVKNTERTAVFCVQKGSTSRALDSGELSGETTILVGMHIPPPGPASEQKKKYFRKKFETRGSSDLGYVISVWLPAIQSALGTIGNCLRRSGKEHNLIVLMDSRYRKRDIRAFFPKPYEIRTITSGSDFKGSDYFPEEDA